MAMPVRQPPTTRTSSGRRARSRPIPPPDLEFKTVELAQRARMIVDVAEADLDAAEEHLGPFHETTWSFRGALAEARNSWDRLRARYGLLALDAALEEPPATVLTLGHTPDGTPLAILIVVDGKTYRVQRLPDAPEAPRIWRLTRLPPHEDGPYHACRLADGSTQCDCAEWTYQIADLSAELCKHLAALDALGWL
ncbi:hypothetical protein [Tautonia plasticadhaerens]|uniref:Uncharacterized protein n=1 Tax=Tautonia plasticadhaerens TaxID=2527974 RepID=A0A518GYB3_9BACT|nr:hypothetical protein [Tautonia plasticadhaerens]QDV33575.1 hypothetical protein ElP_14490 [Tautonia plasticadhaerens]